MNINFPIYRKYPNEKSFFKIIDYSHFEEIHLIGEKCLLSKVEAKILPDRVFIQDMIDENGGHWVESNKDEFEKYLARV